MDPGDAYTTDKTSLSAVDEGDTGSSSPFEEVADPVPSADSEVPEGETSVDADPDEEESPEGESSSPEVFITPSAIHETVPKVKGKIIFPGDFGLAALKYVSTFVKAPGFSVLLVCFCGEWRALIYSTAATSMRYKKDVQGLPTNKFIAAKMLTRKFLRA